MKFYMFFLRFKDNTVGPRTVPARSMTQAWVQILAECSQELNDVIAIEFKSIVD